MRIFIVVDDYVPSSRKVAGKMMHELAKELLFNGHKVTVMTPTHGLDKPFEALSIDDVEVLRFNSRKIKDINKLSRTINESMLSFNGWRALKGRLKTSKYDFILYYSPTIFWGPLIYKLKNIWSAPAYLILRDFYPQMFFDEGLIGKYSLPSFYFRFFERISYFSADIIGIESPKNLAWFSRRKFINRPLSLLYNWAENKPNTPTNHYRDLLGLHDKVVFFYGGNIGPQQDMMNIVRLAQSLINEKDAHFVILGAGFARSMLTKKLDDLALKNVTLLPPVTQEEYKNMLAEFDVGLFSLNKKHTTHNIPGKLLGYMVQAKPILGSINADNDIRDIIEGNMAGLISINGEDNAFRLNAIKLIHDANLRNQMGKNANKLLLNYFSVDSAIKNIMNSYNNHMQNLKN